MAKFWWDISPEEKCSPREFIKAIKPDDIFQIKSGWWVKITEVLPDKIRGYFACDSISLEHQVARYRAVWDRIGREITDPRKSNDWLKLEPIS